MKYLAVILLVAAVHAAPEAEAEADALYGYYGYGRAYGYGGYGRAYGYGYPRYGYYGKRSADAEAEPQVLLNGAIGYGVYGAHHAVAAPAVAGVYAAAPAVAAAPAAVATVAAPAVAAYHAAPAVAAYHADPAVAAYHA